MSIILISCNQNEKIQLYTSNSELNLHELSGPYLGQKPPGMIPEVLAPDFISTEDSELCSGFLDNGRIFIIKRQPRGEKDYSKVPLYITEIKNGIWTKPTLAPFIEYYPYNFTTAPDNKTFWFTSKYIPNGDGIQGNSNIWRMEKTADGWSEPRMLGYPVNTEFWDSYPSVTSDGTMYFMSGRDNGYGSADIYRSRLENGKYRTVKNLGAVVNTDQAELDPAIAPDESYLIYCLEMPGEHENHDLYITFKKEDGTWTKPVNMGKDINTTAPENRVNITPDGRFILFMRVFEENTDIYWVDAKVIESFKPKELR